MNGMPEENENESNITKSSTNVPKSSTNVPKSSTNVPMSLKDSLKKNLGDYNNKSKDLIDKLQTLKNSNEVLINSLGNISFNKNLQTKSNTNKILSFSEFFRQLKEKKGSFNNNKEYSDLLKEYNTLRQDMSDYQKSKWGIRDMTPPYPFNGFEWRDKK